MAITEQCFQQGHLSFVGSKSTLIGCEETNATHCTKPLRVEIDAMYTSEGTHPAGSQWARNPLPACDTPSGGADGNCRSPPQFPPPNNDDRFYGFTGDQLPYAVQDKLQLPADLEEGDYVLGFR